MKFECRFIFKTFFICKTYMTMHIHHLNTKPFEYKSSENYRQKVNNNKYNFFWQKEKRKIIIFTAKLTILCYDKKPTSLQSNGMASIFKNSVLQKIIKVYVLRVSHNIITLQT